MLFKHISPKTIFLFLTTKLAFWSVGMIFFGSTFLGANNQFVLGDYWITRYAMLLLSILAYHNVFRWKRHWIFGGINVCYCFLWLYVVIGYALTGNPFSSLVFRNVCELMFLVWMMFSIHNDPTIFPLEHPEYVYKSLRDSRPHYKTGETNQNEESQSLG